VLFLCNCKTKSTFNFDVAALLLFLRYRIEKINVQHHKQTQQKKQQQEQPTQPKKQKQER
jgi:hypothetical protein